MIILLKLYRLVGCENGIGILTKLQTSLANEETWVDGATEKLSALPTATSALELDVSIESFNRHISFTTVHQITQNFISSHPPQNVSVHLYTKSLYHYFV